jgi:Flp pilus assembly pilin Flp
MYRSKPTEGEEIARIMRRIFKDESGAPSVEYAILVCCIAVAIISTVGIFGQVVGGLYTKVNNQFP